MVTLSTVLYFLYSIFFFFHMWTNSDSALKFYFDKGLGSVPYHLLFLKKAMCNTYQNIQNISCFLWETWRGVINFPLPLKIELLLWLWIIWHNNCVCQNCIHSSSRVSAQLSLKTPKNEDTDCVKSVVHEGIQEFYQGKNGLTKLHFKKA